jgi:two-component system alkaline phosphatase synthesis response regulator PhoP
MLASEGFNVFQAESCKEAIKVVKHNHIDHILSDIKMPEKDGIQTYEEIQKIKQITTTFMSGNFSEEQGEAIRKLHAKIIMKPFKKSELLEVIE